MTDHYRGRDNRLTDVHGNVMSHGRRFPAEALLALQVSHAGPNDYAVRRLPENALSGLNDFLEEIAICPGSWSIIERS